MAAQPGHLYFGYGSNLWRDQMIKRCPTSKYVGIARLNGYRWIINNRGYANVVEVPDSKEAVWGLVYVLKEEDERRLDLNEGVPIAYTKEDLVADYWPAKNGSAPDVTTAPTQTKMLVYIDRKRIDPSKPKHEYIYRMNMGIKDALKEGMPSDYVRDVMRKFIPDAEDESVAEFAKSQAVFFQDENEDA